MGRSFLSVFVLFFVSQNLLYSSNFPKKEKHKGIVPSHRKSLERSYDSSSYDKEARKRVEEWRKKNALIQGGSVPSEPKVLYVVRTVDDKGVSTYYKATQNGGVISYTEAEALRDLSDQALRYARGGYGGRSRTSGFPVDLAILEKAKKKVPQIEEELLPALDRNQEAAQNSVIDFVPIFSSPPTSSTRGLLVESNIAQALNFLSSSEEPSQEQGEQAQAPPVADKPMREAATQYYVNQARETLSQASSIDNVNSEALKILLQTTLNSLALTDAHGGSYKDRAELLKELLKSPDFQYEAPSLLSSPKDLVLFNQAAQAASLASKEGVSLAELETIKNNYALATGTSAIALNENALANLASADSSQNESTTQTTSITTETSLLEVLENAPKQPSKVNAGNKGLALQKQDIIENSEDTTEVEWMRVALWLGSDSSLHSYCQSLNSLQLSSAYADLKRLSFEWEAQGILPLINEYPKLLNSQNLWSKLLTESIDLATKISEETMAHLSQEVLVEERILALRLRARIESYYLESQYKEVQGRGIASNSDLVDAKRQAQQLERLFEKDEVHRFWESKFPHEHRKLQQVRGVLSYFLSLAPQAVSAEASLKPLQGLASCALDYIAQNPSL
jgi:hypothetical protein